MSVPEGRTTWWVPIVQLLRNVGQAPRWVLATFVVYGAILVGMAAWSLSTGNFFGGDPGEYLVTGEGYLTGTSFLFTYPYPLLPLLYVPWLVAIHNPLTLMQIADLFSATLLFGVAAATYVLFQRLVNSPAASLVGALLVGTAPIMLDGVGWGGQAQFLAMIVGTLALVWTVTWTRVPTPRQAVVPGLLLGAGVLAEPYATAFFLVAIAIDLGLRWRRRLLSRGAFVPLATLAAPTVAGAAVLVALQGQVASNALASTLGSEAGNGALWVDLVVRLTFGDPFLLFAYAGLVLLYVLRGAFFGPSQGDQPRPYILPALGLAVGAEAVLLTPAAFADRFLYFVPLPLGLMAARLIARPPPTVPALSPAPGGRHAHRHSVVPTVGVVPFLVVCILFVQVGTASITYPGSLAFYGEPDGGISDLTSLSGKSGSLLYVDPNVDMFPAAFASDHNLYPTVQPYWFTQNAQQSAAVDALTLTAGTQWIDAGATRVVDSEPEVGTGSPSILSSLSATELDILRLNDSASTLSWRSLGNGSLTSTSLGLAPVLTTSDVASSLLDTYGWPTTWANKTTTTTGGAVLVRLDLTSANADWTQANMTFESPDCTVLNVTTHPAAGGGIWANLTQAYQAPWITTTFVTPVEITGSNISSVAVDLSTSSTGVPLLRFAITPTLGHSQMQVLLHVQPPSAVSTEPTIVQEAGAFAHDGIRWVVLHLPAALADVSRFQNDALLAPYESTPSYRIYLVEVTGP